MVRYTPVSSHSASAARPKHTYRNSSDLNIMIDDLKPNTEYEFTAKIVKGKRRQSSWSLVVTNKTLGLFREAVAWGFTVKTQLSVGSAEIPVEFGDQHVDLVALA